MCLWTLFFLLLCCSKLSMCFWHSESNRWAVLQPINTAWNSVDSNKVCPTQLLLISWTTLKFQGSRNKIEHQLLLWCQWFKWTATTELWEEMLAYVVLPVLQVPTNVTFITLLKTGEFCLMLEPWLSSHDLSFLHLLQGKKIQNQKTKTISGTGFVLSKESCFPTLHEDQRFFLLVERRSLWVLTH